MIGSGISGLSAKGFPYANGLPLAIDPSRHRFAGGAPIRAAPACPSARDRAVGSRHAPDYIPQDLPIVPGLAVLVVLTACRRAAARPARKARRLRDYRPARPAILSVAIGRRARASAPRNAYAAAAAYAATRTPTRRPDS